MGRLPLHYQGSGPGGAELLVNRLGLLREGAERVGQGGDVGEVGLPRRGDLGVGDAVDFGHHVTELLEDELLLTGGEFQFHDLTPGKERPRFCGPFLSREA